MTKFNQEEGDKTLNANRIIGGDMINDLKQLVIYKKAAWPIIKKLLPTLNEISRHLQIEVEMPESEYANWGKSLIAAAGPHLQ